MSDINSGLPIRTQLPGQVAYDDVIVKVGDGTTPTQLLGIDSAGRVSSKLFDGAGNAVTSQVNGAQRALDVGINVAGVQIDPRQIRALTSSDVVTANQGTANTATNGWFIKITDGTNTAAVKAASTAALAADPSLVVAFSPNSPLPTGSNVIGSVNQGTSPWITRDQADGSATGGTAATFSSLAGGIYNTSLPTLTNGQQSAIQLDSSARVIIAPLTNASIVKAQLQDNAGAAITLGQKTMSASVPVVLASDQTPIPVTISADAYGTEINNYNTASALASLATSNHDYTVTATKTLLLTQIEASASGRMKIEVQIETGVASGVFQTRFVQFNSSSETNMSITLKSPISVAAGVRVRVIRTNRDLLPQDVYSTICGQETP